VSDSNVIKLAQPGAFADSLTDILRQGARALLTQAVEAEVAEFLGRHAGLKTEDGHQRVVRHGHLPERDIMTGIGPVAVRQPRVRDREVGEEGRIRFSPSILPPYARRSKSLEVLIPILYLKGISTGDFEEALAALVGRNAPGLSASTIARLAQMWAEGPGTDFSTLLPAVGISAEAWAWPVARLSTGERQRLALLRALNPENRVLLLDEPTSGLVPRTRA